MENTVLGKLEDINKQIEENAQILSLLEKKINSIESGQESMKFGLSLIERFSFHSWKNSNQMNQKS